MSKCPVGECPKTPKAGHLMCLGHWRLVPRKLQQAVNRTWRNYRNDRQAYHDAKDAAVRAAEKESASATQGGLF